MSSTGFVPAEASGAGNEAVPVTRSPWVGIATGLVALHAVEPAALDAAQAILDEFAHGRVIGKLLGDRRVSGDVTGLAPGKFDMAGQRPQRPRLGHRQVDARIQRRAGVTTSTS